MPEPAPVTRVILLRRLNMAEFSHSSLQPCRRELTLPTRRWRWKFEVGAKTTVFRPESRAPVRGLRRCGHKHFPGPGGPKNLRGPWRKEAGCEGRLRSSVCAWREAFRKGLPGR